MHKYYEVSKLAFHLINEIRKMNGEKDVESFDDISPERQQYSYDLVEKVLDNKNLTGEMLHYEWKQQRLKDGWSYGTPTDRENKIHECLCPYEDLNPFQKLKDNIFISTVNSYRNDLIKDDGRWKIIAFDFDGVIHRYSQGWKGVENIYDPPMEGAKEFIAKLKEKYKIYVVSSRCSEDNGRWAVAQWLEKYGIVVDRVCSLKPPASVTIDDRCIRFKEFSDDLYQDIMEFVENKGKGVT